MEDDTSASVLREIQQEGLGKGTGRATCGLTRLMRSEGACCWTLGNEAKVAGLHGSRQDWSGYIQGKRSPFSNNHPCIREGVFGEPSLTYGNSVCFIWTYGGNICVGITSCLLLCAISLHWVNATQPHASPEKSCPPYSAWAAQCLFCMGNTPRAFLRPFLWLTHVPLQLGEAVRQREETRMTTGTGVIASPALETFVLC